MNPFEEVCNNLNLACLVMQGKASYYIPLPKDKKTMTNSIFKELDSIYIRAEIIQKNIQQTKPFLSGDTPYNRDLLDTISEEAMMIITTVEKIRD